MARSRHVRALALLGLLAPALAGCGRFYWARAGRGAALAAATRPARPPELDDSTQCSA